MNDLANHRRTSTLGASSSTSYWVTCASAAVLLVACGGEATVHAPNESDPELAELPQAQLICDGSDEIRFAFASGGGGRLGLEDLYGGTQFITIDGHCRFWVREQTLRGLRTGVLDEAFAARLSSELHIGQYASVQSYKSAVCPDSGVSRIWDGHDTLEEYCSTGDAPTVWREAFLRIGPLYEELEPMSSPAWEKTQIVPLRGPRRPDVLQPLAWTATLDLDRYAVGDEGGYESGVLVEDGPTLAVLADLRLGMIEASAAVASPGDELDYLHRGLFVVDAQGREFQVLLRDEPPSAIARAARFEFGSP